MALHKFPWNALIAQTPPENLEREESHTDNKSGLLGKGNFAPLELIVTLLQNNQILYLHNEG